MYTSIGFPSMAEGVIRGKGAHVNACISGLLGRARVFSSSPSSMESRRGLLIWESDEELERRLGVVDFLRELPLELE